MIELIQDKEYGLLLMQAFKSLSDIVNETLLSQKYSSNPIDKQKLDTQY